MWRLRQISIIPNVRQDYYFEKDFNSWDPKIHGPRNYPKIVYVAALIDECGTNKNYPLSMFRNGISKIRYHLI